MVPSTSRTEPESFARVPSRTPATAPDEPAARRARRRRTSRAPSPARRSRRRATSRPRRGTPDRPGGEGVHHQRDPPVEYVGEVARPRPRPRTVRLRCAPPRTASISEQAGERERARHRSTSRIARCGVDAQRQHGGGGARRARGRSRRRRRRRSAPARMPASPRPRSEEPARGGPRPVSPGRWPRARRRCRSSVRVVRIASSSLPIPKKRTPPPGFGPSTESEVSGEPAITSIAWAPTVTPQASARPARPGTSTAVREPRAGRPEPHRSAPTRARRRRPRRRRAGAAAPRRRRARTAPSRTGPPARGTRAPRRPRRRARPAGAGAPTVSRLGRSASLSWRSATSSGSRSPSARIALPFISSGTSTPSHSSTVGATSVARTTPSVRVESEVRLPSKPAARDPGRPQRLLAAAAGGERDQEVVRAEPPHEVAELGELGPDHGHPGRAVALRTPVRGEVDVAVAVGGDQRRQPVGAARRRRPAGVLERRRQQSGDDVGRGVLRAVDDPVPDPVLELALADVDGGRSAVVEALVDPVALADVEEALRRRRRADARRS